MRLTLAVVALAPIGVFGFMLSAAAGHGLAAFEALGLYALTVFAGLLLHAGVTLPTIVWVFAKRSPLQHVKTMTPALLTAFSTASSNGTLPLTMKCVEEAGVPNEVSSFVLPLGATINMDGTALYEAVAVLFIAQVYGMDLSLGQQAVVALTALLASVGAAGIPHAGTVMMVVVLSAVGLPTTAVGLILAVDRILDMCRTTVNVYSDTVAAVVVTRMAGLSSDASKPST
jgi:Na+/H+-dicarboxylate symporter